MTIHAIVPVKPLHLGKSRLSHLLSSQQRHALVTQLLKHTLIALTQSKIATVWVISQDELVWSLAQQHKARVIHEKVDGHVDNLNQAVTQAAQTVISDGATGALILPADLPLLTPTDIDDLLTDFTPPQLLICPDRHHAGRRRGSVRASAASAGNEYRDRQQRQYETERPCGPDHT